MKLNAIRALLITGLLFGPSNLNACLGCHHSLDWQTAHARLIIVGQVVAVEDVKRVKNRLSGAAALFAAPTEEGAEEESSIDSRSKPQVATVRVLRVLKGVWGGQDLRIGSGPIDSCSMSPVHFRYTVGEKAIFLLSEPLADSRTVLRYGGSFCELTQTEAIIACLDRCMAWRQAWLDEMQLDHPQDLAANAVRT